MFFPILLLYLVLIGEVRKVQMRGMSVLELLVEQEGKAVPEVKMKVFAPKYGDMKLGDYSVNPGTEFWAKVKKVSWQEAQGT